MKQETQRSIRQFFAALTILSFTLTQAVPAWAMRPEGGGSPVTQSGLEEALKAAGPEERSARVGGGAAAGGTGVVDIPKPLLRLLRARQTRAVKDRIAALRDYAGQLAVGAGVIEGIGDPNVPLERRVAVLDDLLGMALEDSVLGESEVDPELAVALLTQSDPRTLQKARAAFSALERICPTCGDHLYHEQGRGQADLEFDQHDLLHVRTAIATAVEFLSSPTGRLPIVQRVRDGHHTEEPARSLGVMALMVSAFARNDEGPETPSVSAVRLGNDPGFLERLGVVTAQAGAVILRLRHPRTRGDEADTWMSVRYVDREKRTVDLYVNGETGTLSWDQFRRDVLPPPGDVHGLLTSGQASLWFETEVGPLAAATPEELQSVIGCCGIIITMGRRSGEGQFASMQDLAYRGQDNAGVTVHDLDGLYTIKVEGSPTQLIGELEVEGQGHAEEGMAWYLETFPGAELDPRVREGLQKLRSGRALNQQERRSIHRLWMNLTEEQRAAIAGTSRANGREILNAHNYAAIEPSAPGTEGTPPHVTLPLRKDDLYSQRFYAETDQAVVSPEPGRPRKQAGEIDQWNSVGRGNQGEVWAGRSFGVPPAAASTYEAHVEALQAFMRDVNRYYDYELSYIRDRLRFFLSERLDAAVAQEKLSGDDAATVRREFLRLFETVALGRDLVESDLELWRGIWSIMANGTVWFAGHIPWDPVRHVFRLQKGLVGILRQRPRWQEELEREFATLLRRDRIFEARDWFQDWLTENFSNTPSKAFEALISWFQKEFIPDHIRRRMGIELGRVDAITLQYLEIVDEVFGHDRWATTGSKEAKDAQPHMDTGLLSGLSRSEKAELVRQATGAGTGSPMNLQVSGTATALERDQIRKLLVENFRAVATRFLASRPEKVGSPQRSTPHNGDLDSGVQQEIRPKLAQRGYLPIRRVVSEDADGNWQVLTETILTDTWGLLGGHEDIYDAFELDTLLGFTDGQRYKEDQQNDVGFMPDAYRKKWNEIADNLLRAQRHGQRAVPITEGFNLAEEISHRLVNLEFARGILYKPGRAGSEIGAGLMTTMEPRLKVFVSHNRPIYLMAVRAKDGQLVWQVSSDYRTALRLFNRGEVAKGVQDSNALFLWKERALEELDQQHLPEAEHAEREAEIFRRAEAEQKAINDRFKLEFMLAFKGEEKYIHTGREFNPEAGQWDLILDVSNFEGKTTARYRNGQVVQPPPEQEAKSIKVERNKSVEVDIASRFGFPSYGEKEIHQIPLALRETRFWYGLKPDGTLDMSREAVGALYGAAVDYGLNRQQLMDWFRGGGNTIILTGVGSSENDALAVEALLKYLLPGVRVIIKDPSTLLNTAADFDPKTTMVVGLSWSGTTALTLSILESLRERGLLCCAITGNPDKEIGVAARDSGGVVKAHTRQEVAVYTTVGFSTILYDLMLMSVYLNGLKEELETEAARKADLRRRRSEVARDLHAVPEIIRGLRDRPERNLSRPDSYIHQVGGRLAPYNGMGFVGDDPSLPEIALKVGEVRNAGHTVYPAYSSDQPWHLIRKGMPEKQRKGWFVDATTVPKFRRALAWIQEALERGQPLVVQTFDEEVVLPQEEIQWGYQEVWRELSAELKTRAEAGGKDGRPHLDIFRVPRVHPLVQPIVNVQIGAPLATTTAKLAGLGSEARDTPRNIAKSVTVQAQGRQSRAMRIRDFVQTYQATAAGMEEQEFMARYAQDLSRRWDPMDHTLRVIHRLPLRMQEILAGFSTPRGFPWDGAAMTQRFGERLGGLKRVVILSSEDENADIAARMAQELLEYRESVTTNSEKEKVFQKVRDEGGQYEENAVQRLINGDMHEIRFIRSPGDHPNESKIIITRMTEEDGEWRPVRRELVLLGDERGIVAFEPAYGHLVRREGGLIQYQVNGQWYVIRADVGRGVNLTAVEPELAGVEVEVVAVEEEEDLQKATVHPEDTLVVALSRSHQRKKEFEGEIAPTASLGRGRDLGQKQGLRTAPGVKSEESFSRILEGLKRQHPELAVFSAASGGSPIHQHANVGSAQLPDDLDVIDATPAFYLALLRLGVRIGTLKGVTQAAAYEEGLNLLPELAARALASGYQERLVVGTELFSRATQGIQVALNHRPIEVRYEPESERLTFHDQSGEFSGFDLVVDTDRDMVRGFRNPENVLNLDGRQYGIQFHPDHGIVIESRLPDYAGGGSLLDSLVSLVQRESGNPYTNWILVGGGADLASALLYRKQMTALGRVQGHALVVDGSVHGPLAEVDDRVAKWLDRARRRGIDPGYDPDNPKDLTQKDTATVVLGTDRRAYSAATIDLQRFVTRSGVVFWVGQVPDLNRSEIIESRAFLTLGVPEAPNLLSVIPHMVLAPLFSYQLGQSQGDPYRYQPGSTGAEVARLPRVISAGEGEAVPMPTWERAVRRRVGPDRPDLAQWLTALYDPYRSSPNRPLIETRISTAHPGTTSFVAVIPYEHVEGREPIAGINSRLEQRFREQGRRLDYDTRYYWAGFQEGREAPMAGLFHVAFRTSDVEALGGAGAVEVMVRDALRPYVRGERLAAPEAGPRGPVHGIVWGPNAEAVVQDNAVRWRAERGLGSIARSLAWTVRGAVAMPPGVSSLSGMGSPRETGSARANLDQMAEHVRTVYARRLLERAAYLMELSLARRPRQDRLGLIDLGDNSLGWIVAGESVKALLTNNYGASLQTGETGSGVVMVYLDPIAAQWVLPEGLDLMYNEPYLIQLVTHIPREAWERMEEEQRQRVLNPLPSVELDADGTTELERQLDELARLNNIPPDPADPKGRPDLSRVRVGHLPRERSRLLAEEFERLSRVRELRRNFQPDGSIILGIAAVLPPRDAQAGYTQEDPLEVSWTTTWATQGLQLLTAIGGGALPEGAVGAVRFLPRSVNEPASLGAATPANPIGGVTSWTEPERLAFRNWQADLGASLAEGRPLYHTDITGETGLIFIPTTDLGVDLHDPIRGVLGIPGLEFQAEGSQVHYYAVVAEDENLYVEEIQAPVRPDAPVPPFLPPADLQFQPEMERVSFRLQVERWVNQWTQDRGLEPSNEATRQFVETAASSFGQYRSQDNLAQLARMDHPSGDRNRALVLVLAPQRDGLAQDVQQWIRNTGARVTGIQTWIYRQDVAFVLLETVLLRSEDIPSIRTTLRMRPVATSETERALQQELEERMRNPDEIGRSLYVYGNYRGTPGIAIEEDRASGELFITGIAPYSETLPADFESRLTSLVLTNVPSDQPVSPIVFIHEFRRTSPPLAFFEISMNLSQAELIQYGSLDALEQYLEGLAGETTAGMEEQPEFDWYDEAGTVGWRVKKAGVIKGRDVNPIMELRHGVNLIAARGESRIELAEGVILEPDSSVVAPVDSKGKGTVVKIGPSSRVLAGAKIWGNAVLGSNVEFSGTIDAVAIGAEVLIGDDTKFARGSNTVVSKSLLLPFQGLPVKVNWASTIANSVVWGGSTLFQDAKVRDSVVGPFVVLGNDVVAARSVLFGAGPGNDSSGAHYNGILTTVMLPIEILAVPYSDAYHEELRNKLTAFLFGTEVSRTQEPLVTPEAAAGFPVHRVRPYERLTRELDGARVEMGVQGINAGLGASSSNLNPLNQGDKGPAILSAGAMFGDHAVWYHPVFVGPRALVGIHAIVSGEEALRPGTMVRPKGAERAVLPGVLDERYGTIGPKAEERVRVHLEAVRMYGTMAEAFAAGLPKVSTGAERMGLQRSLQIVQTIQTEVAGDLAVYLAKVGESARRLPALIAKATGKEGQQLEQWRTEQEGLFKRQAEILAQIRTAQERVAAAQAAGVEEYTMATIAGFSRPATGIVELREGMPAFGPDWVSRGLLKARDPRTKPLYILFGAGAFSRFVDSVNKSSPFFAEAAGQRGRVNSDGGASKLVAPLGVSGMGPLLRELEAISDIGFRARELQLTVIVDSPGNRGMLLRAVEEDRESANPRIAWNYLQILPAGIPVDQGEGIQVQYRDSAGNLQPLYEYNPATGAMDKPVLRPSGEYGAFRAGMVAAETAGINLSSRDVVPMYTDQAMLYDPDLLAAALGHADNADITGLNVGHRQVDGQWVPSGGVWTQARWADGTEALVIAERNVRDPGATGVYNSRLDPDELADPQRFPYNAAAPILRGGYVTAELSPEGMAKRLSSKTIPVQTGPAASEAREVYVTELELTEAVQKATQHPAGQAPAWTAQMLVTEDWRYKGVKFYQDIEPTNQEIFRVGRETFRARLGGRLEGETPYVEVSPRAKGFRGEGKIKVSGADRYGLVQDRRGLWVHQKIEVPAGTEAPTLFTEKGYLVLPADAEGNIPLERVVEITPETYGELAAQAGAEESLSLPQIYERLVPLLDRFSTTPPTLLAMDVDGVTTDQDGVISDAMRDAYTGFVQGVPEGKGRVMLLTDISREQARDRVQSRLPAETLERTISMPLSGALYVGHIISEGSLDVLDRFVERMGGKETVLRMDAKRKEHADEQISDESLGKGYDVNRTEDGRIGAIDVELNKDWLKARTAEAQAEAAKRLSPEEAKKVDPRDGWVGEIQKDLRDIGVPEPIVQTLHRAGTGSMTWVPPKGGTLRRWVQEQKLDPQETVFVDDSASNFKDFPELESWPGTLIYIGKPDASLPANVIQIARSGEPKLANGPEIARQIVQLARAVHAIGGVAAAEMAADGTVAGRPPVQRVLEQAGLAAGLEQVEPVVPPFAPVLPTTRGLADTGTALTQTTITRTAAGPAPETITRLRELRQKLIIPSAPQSAQGAVGVVAGPADPRAWPIAASLSQVVTPTGPIPVVFLVEEEADARLLQALELPLVEIIQIGGFYGEIAVRDYAQARELADRWLRSFGGATRIEEIGTQGPVTESLDDLLRRFGVSFTVDSFIHWQEFVDEVVRARAA